MVETIPEKKPIVVDFNREETLLQILPCAPLLSSNKAEWDGIHIEYYRHPPHEMPEYISLQHKITRVFRQHLATTPKAYRDAL